MQLALIALFVVVAVLLVVRAARRNRTDYRRFKRLRTTRERQFVFAKWLRESFFVFGGLAIAVLLASWQYVSVAATDARSWQPLAWLARALSGGVGAGVAAGAVIVLVAVLLLPVILLRRSNAELPTIGDIGSLLPRTRGELIYGAGLSINAGLVEELLFRLGMPALLFGITGNGIVAFTLAAVLFGLLHLYQKFWGVLGATILGLAFSVVYLLTNSIVVVIVIHALIDLRSLVLIPLVVQRVWNVRELATTAGADTATPNPTAPDEPIATELP
ncbi:MAG: family intrarane metalloprotease [Glaciihabitans sp.]|nr:family intrarane metalloprotease [Glaciihabitans sp.]